MITIVTYFLTMPVGGRRTASIVVGDILPGSFRRTILIGSTVRYGKFFWNLILRKTETP